MIIINLYIFYSMEQDSFDSFDDIEEMVMAANNLSLSPNGAMSGDQRDSLNVSGEEDELPKSIIVTNVDLSVFDNLDIKVIKMPNSMNLRKKERKKERKNSSNWDVI